LTFYRKHEKGTFMAHDVIILGGGPNGLATALALGGSALPTPLRVLLLDRRDPTAPSTDTRGTALTLATQSMLRVLNVWNDLAPDACEMRDVVVTDGNDFDQLLRLSTNTASNAAASMVENSKLHRSLVEAVLKSPNIKVQGGFQFERFETTPSKIIVRDPQDAVFNAALLVAADGRKSLVRQQLGTKVTQHDYGQTALGFSITLSEPHLHQAEERFSAKGVFAFLPLPGLAASIVWGTSPDHATELMRLSDVDFNTALQDKIGDRYGKVYVTGKRQAFPVVMQIANDMKGPRIALLGDAAHAIHPLAGLGLNLGFKDAAALADQVFAAVRRGSDMGGESVLENYQTQRRFDTISTSWAMDGLNGLFANHNPILTPLRKMGLSAVQRVDGLKSAIVQQASGQSQSNPRLMQGLLPG
jgi:2-octaprenyl-6-methoxyphenol hydroxylase